MNLVIPKELHKQVRTRARKYGISEDKYVRTVLAQALQSDDSLDAEMRLWEGSSLRDFETFVKKHSL